VPSDDRTQSNPRKVRRGGNSIVVSIPEELLETCDMEVGDRVILREEQSGFSVLPVTWEVADP
jgi:antitoxin component of MazEF toxin-antitoxin module